jgi:hypothetical protein
MRASLHNFRGAVLDTIIDCLNTIVKLAAIAIWIG